MYLPIKDLNVINDSVCLFVKDQTNHYLYKLKFNFSCNFK